MKFSIVGLVLIITEVLTIDYGLQGMRAESWRNEQRDLKKKQQSEA